MNKRTICAMLLVLCAALSACTVSITPKSEDSPTQDRNETTESSSAPSSEDTERGLGDSGADQESAASPSIEPIEADSRMITSDDPAFSRALAMKGTNYYFNEHEVVTAENNPGPVGAAGLAVDSNFAWDHAADGTPVLMILAEAEPGWEGENYNLLLPPFGMPSILKNGNDINLVWTAPSGSGDGIYLSFQDGSSEMLVVKNKRTGARESTIVALDAPARGDGSGGNRFWLPLGAILSQTGGGILVDPLGDGTNFIYSGDAIAGYTGMWETADRTDTAESDDTETADPDLVAEPIVTEYRTDVVINGETISIASYWTGLDLREDGTFLESDRFWQDSEEWVLWERKGRYAFFGRILVMCIETESEYRGADYIALEPVRLDEPHEGWGKVTGASVYARYIDEWTEDYLQIHGWNILYSGMRERGEAAPRPGKVDFGE